MKLCKKLLSAVAVLALVATAVPVNASAAANVLDFEDGNIPTAIQMALLEDGTADGDPALLSVVDFNGSKMLKIDSQANGTPKIKFNLVPLVGEANIGTVKGIQYDLIIEKPDDVMTTWNGGTVGAGAYGIMGSWVNGTEWTLQDDTKNVSDVTLLKNVLNADFGFTDPEEAFFMFMNWANNGTDMYIDNVQLLDADGNALELTGLDAAPAEEVAAVPQTGTSSYAIYFAIGAVVMVAGAVVLKKRKSVEA